jgi:beta-galactosidase GanA
MTTTNQLPHLARVNGATRLIVDGSPTLLRGGELHNSSASSLAYMNREVWNRVESIGCNMILPALGWEQIEPREGSFDFTLIDGLVEQAQKRNVLLAPLWFGAYKNAQSNYAPAWVKTDIERFPRAEARTGIRLEAVSVLSNELREADSKAFAAMMTRIREIDPTGETVVMMQVENEVGLLGGSRDLSALSRRAYEAEVPKQLTDYLAGNRSHLQPELRSMWERHGSLEEGAWSALFGGEADGDEVFMAWHFASYVGAVASAGIARHPIPMYANAWLVQNDAQKAGDYPSGGPVAHMIDVWRAAAPNLAFLAPDIYLPGFEKECRRYNQPANTLFIPEMSRDHSAAAKAFYAIGEHAAIGVAPFGIDSMEGGDAGSVPAPLSPARLLQSTYRLLGDMAPLLLSVDAAATRGFIEDVTVAESPSVIIDLGDYRIIIDWENALKVREGRRKPGDASICGGGLVIRIAPEEFVIAGFGFRARFECPGEPGSAVEYLAIDEGDFAAGEWVPGRRLNGDEYRIDLWIGVDGKPQIRRVAPYRYPALTV